VKTFKKGNTEDPGDSRARVTKFIFNFYTDFFLDGANK